MNRRGFLKRASLFGAGAIAASLSFGGQTEAMENQYYLITGDPDRDTRRLLQLIGRRSGPGLQVESTSIQPSPQDLSLISGGQVVDPRNPSVPGKLQGFAAELRNRSNHAHTMVSISRASRQRNNIAMFEVNGRTVEQVDLSRDYKNIVIAGTQGNTTFQVVNGQLSVVNSSCRHHLCQKMGARKSGRIICAPNKLVASVSGIRQDLDGVTG